MNTTVLDKNTVTFYTLVCYMSVRFVRLRVHMYCTATHVCRHVAVQHAYNYIHMCAQA